jgi:hypothetical protein
LISLMRKELERLEKDNKIPALFKEKSDEL